EAARLMGELDLAARLRRLLGGPDEALEPSSRRLVPPLPEHARVRLGRTRETEMVHQRRHPLHLARLREADPPDRPGVSRGVPGGPCGERGLRGLDVTSHTTRMRHTGLA